MIFKDDTRDQYIGKWNWTAEGYVNLVYDNAYVRKHIIFEKLSDTVAISKSGENDLDIPIQGSSKLFKLTESVLSTEIDKETRKFDEFIIKTQNSYSAQASEKLIIITRNIEGVWSNTDNREEGVATGKVTIILEKKG